jgi:hypothetical protein
MVLGFRVVTLGVGRWFSDQYNKLTDPFALFTELPLTDILGNSR